MAVAQSYEAAPRRPVLSLQAVTMATLIVAVAVMVVATASLARGEAACATKQPV